MELYVSLDSILDYSPQTAGYPRLRKTGEKRGSLEGLLNEKVQTLVDILDQIAGEIRERAGLSGRVTWQIDNHYCRLKSKLLQLDHWHLGANRNIESRRTALETQLDTLLHEKRQEQILCWQDIARLKTEFRTWFKQYRDLVERVRIIAPSPESGRFQSEIR